MNKIIEKYIINGEDIFEDNDKNEDNAIKDALSNLLKKLPAVSSDEWIEIFNLMNSNSIGTKVNIKEAYTVATSKIINGYAIQNKYLFAQNQKEVSFYNLGWWTNLDDSLLKEFLKTASNKICIPEYIASSITFINKLQKQFIQDAYFEKKLNKDTTFINLKNGTLSIDKSGINFVNHHPKHFLQYILDYEYSKNEKQDNFLDAIQCSILSTNVMDTLQQSIAQVLIKNFDNSKKVCLYGLNVNITNDFINMLKEVIPNSLVQDYFKNDDAVLEDLFIHFKDIKKDKQSLEQVTFISFENSSVDNLPANIHINKSAVLNWLADGAKEIIKNRQVYIAQECENFDSRFNLVNLFVKDLNLIKTPKHSKSIVSTYENILKQYESFCELHDEEPLGRGKFNKELKALGFESTRRGTGNVWFAKFA